MSNYISLFHVDVLTYPRRIPYAGLTNLCKYKGTLDKDMNVPRPGQIGRLWFISITYLSASHSLH